MSVIGAVRLMIRPGARCWNISQSAIQIGLTATPKETEYISNIDYFGEPTYTYSLKQGIEDGFLAPYKVIRINVDKDVDGWMPFPGQKDKYGNVIQDREYGISDWDRTVVMEQRNAVGGPARGRIFAADGSLCQNDCFLCRYCPCGANAAAVGECHWRRGGQQCAVM